VAGGTTDTGWQSYGPYDVTSSLGTLSSVYIRIETTDAWTANWLKTNWWDDVGLDCTIANNPPTFTSITDSPDSVSLGSTVDMTTVAFDTDGADTLKLFVCKASDGTSSGCGAGGTWCSSFFLPSSLCLSVCLSFCPSVFLSCGFGEEQKEKERKKVRKKWRQGRKERRERCRREGGKTRQD